MNRAALVNITPPDPTASGEPASRLRPSCVPRQPAPHGHDSLRRGCGRIPPGDGRRIWVFCVSRLLGRVAGFDAQGVKSHVRRPPRKRQIVRSEVSAPVPASAYQAIITAPSAFAPVACLADHFCVSRNSINAIIAITARSMKASSTPSFASLPLRINALIRFTFSMPRMKAFFHAGIPMSSAAR